MCATALTTGAVAVQRAPRHQEGRRVPALPGHAHRRQRAAVEPLGESPVVAARWPAPAPQAARACSCRPSRASAMHPEAADEGPDAAVVVLVHAGSAGGAPCRAATARAGATAGAARRAPDTAGRRLPCAMVSTMRWPIAPSASPHRIASRLPNTSPSSPATARLTKLRYRPGSRAAAARVVAQQARAVVLGQVALERVEQVVEVVARRLGVGQRVAALDLVPQRVAVQHVARARHDVGPVAGLVLLQQPEALVLLRQQPGDARARPPAPPARRGDAPWRRRWSTAISHHSVASMQPRYQKSASRPSGSTYFGIWPLRACCAASASRLATAPCSSAASPLPHIASTQIAASRPKMRV